MRIFFMHYQAERRSPLWFLWALLPGFAMTTAINSTVGPLVRFALHDLRVHGSSGRWHWVGAFGRTVWMSHVLVGAALALATASFARRACGSARSWLIPATMVLLG